MPGPTATESSPLRAAVLGAGTMGRWHARAIEAAGGVLAAVADPDLERARALAGAAPAYPSLDRLLAAGEPIDVAHVCAPLAQHEPLARRALEAGAHVVVEKPLTANAAGTEALLETAAGRGLAVVPVHQFLFQPGVRRLLEERERLGPLVRCAFVAATAGAEKTGLAPDELVAEVLPHPLSIFARLVALPSGADDWAVLRPAPGELRALTSVEGTTLEIVVTTRGRPTRAELELTGTEASGYADLYHGFAVVDRLPATRAGKALRPFALASSRLAHAGTNLATRAARRETAYPGLRELVRLTYDALSAGGQPPLDARETIAVARARDAILSA